MDDVTRLDDRVAIVTGGGGGIGGGVSRRFGALGAHVVLNDIDADLAAAAAEAVTAAGGRAHAVVGDIRDQAVVDRLVDEALDVGSGRIDVLVNNVGDYRPSGRFVETGPDDWAAQHAITFAHVLACTRRVLPVMQAQGRGAIVNNSTVEALRGIPRNTVYSAYNAAVIAFTRSLAVEVAGDGIRVNAIAPDMADTLQTPAEAMLRGRDPDLIRCWIPLGRFGRPDDYADVVAFLASDQSRFVTGHVVPVDGGTMAASGWYGRAARRGWTNLPDHP